MCLHQTEEGLFRAERINWRVHAERVDWEEEVKKEEHLLLMTALSYVSGLQVTRKTDSEDRLTVTFTCKTRDDEKVNESSKKSFTPLVFAVNACLVFSSKKHFIRRRTYTRLFESREDCFRTFLSRGHRGIKEVKNTFTTVHDLQEPEIYT